MLRAPLVAVQKREPVAPRREGPLVIDTRERAAPPERHVDRDDAEVPRRAPRGHVARDALDRVVRAVEAPLDLGRRAVQRDGVDAGPGPRGGGGLLLPLRSLFVRRRDGRRRRRREGDPGAGAGAAEVVPVPAARVDGLAPLARGDLERGEGRALHEDVVLEDEERRDVGVLAQHGRVEGDEVEGGLRREERGARLGAVDVVVVEAPDGRPADGRVREFVGDAREVAHGEGRVGARVPHRVGDAARGMRGVVGHDEVEVEPRGVEVRAHRRERRRHGARPVREERHVGAVLGRRRDAVLPARRDGRVVVVVDRAAFRPRRGLLPLRREAPHVAAVREEHGLVGDRGAPPRRRVERQRVGRHVDRDGRRVAGDHDDTSRRRRRLRGGSRRRLL
mmetsp:Transcript_4383/g.17781  ORF Transcript_4383/g.17781 Transcript_4383/m.17781 type:complete len:392 (-) Transcript_4383:1547-2722(-)